MLKEDLLFALQKKVRINLTNGFHYTGVIRELNDDSFLFTDKFGNNVVMRYDMVAIVQEVKEE